MTSKKVASVGFIKDGKILITFEDKTLTTADKQQLELMQILGASLPRTGVEYVTQESVHPVTGETNPTWVKLVL